MNLRSAVFVLLLVTLSVNFLSLQPVKAYSTGTKEAAAVYVDFLIDYAPAYYYNTTSDSVETSWGSGPAPAAFAIQALYSAYYHPYFRSRQAEIYAKIVECANLIVAYQCDEPAKLAYGGFKPASDGTYYYAIDGARGLEGLIYAYKLTGNSSYLTAAGKAVQFLYVMQHYCPDNGLHDQYYGGFAQLVTYGGAWGTDMHTLDLYAAAPLKDYYVLTGNTTALEIAEDAADFLDYGVANGYLYFNPPIYGDNTWKRYGGWGVYDDDMSYALYGLYSLEGWTSRVATPYDFYQTVGAGEYAGYDPDVCWTGYINVTGHTCAAGYYDIVTAGILGPIRFAHDETAYEKSVASAVAHTPLYLYWGVEFPSFTVLTDWQSTVTAAWIAMLLINYVEPTPAQINLIDTTGNVYLAFELIGVAMLVLIAGAIVFVLKAGGDLKVVLVLVLALSILMALLMLLPVVHSFEGILGY